MKKFGIGILISGVLVGLGFHYWELRWQLQTSQFRNDIWNSENRIMRDEINSLGRRRTYEQGVLDTIIRQKLDSGFEDGLLHAYSAMPKEADDVIDAYHRATEHHWAGMYYQTKILEKKMEDAKKLSYSEGRKNGYDTAKEESLAEQSHPDYNPRQKLQKELDSKSPFKTVDNEDGQN